jgi:protocatechuate 3,4-dioxygenase beta subunit
MKRLNRRQTLQSIAGFSAVAGISAMASLDTTLWQPGAFAETLDSKATRPLTAGLTEGPFYPDRLPLDTDNDLLVINDGITPAVGEVTYLSGQVLTQAGTPIRNALVEIWQVDALGVYLHTRSARSGKRDSNFQGYGRFLTDGAGRYFFRTVKPITYPGRTPHIHFAVSQNGHRVLTTQLLIAGHPQNEKDGVFRRLKKAEERQTVVADFVKIPDAPTTQWTTQFDLVLGVTSADPAEKA